MCIIQSITNACSYSLIRWRVCSRIECNPLFARLKPSALMRPWGVPVHQYVLCAENICSRERIIKTHISRITSKSMHKPLYTPGHCLQGEGTDGLLRGQTNSLGEHCFCGEREGRVCSSWKNVCTYVQYLYMVWEACSKSTGNFPFWKKITLVINVGGYYCK